MGNLRSRALLAAGLAAGVTHLAACTERREEKASAPHVPATNSPRQALHDAFPLARVDATNGRPTRVYGTALATGATLNDAAERFRLTHAASLGIPASDLLPRDFSGRAAPANAAPKPLGLMFDRNTGKYKFWLYRYGQAKAGVPVFRAGLLALVKNQVDNPVVWAASFVRDLSTFTPPRGAPAAAADPDKSLAAIRGTTDSSGRPLPAPKRITRLSPSTPVVFAGRDGQDVPPRLALEYTVETADPPQTWRLVADAVTANVLHAENLVVFENVTGTVTALATQGGKSMDCADEVPTGFPYAEVTGGGATAFSDLQGHFLLNISGSSPLALSSPTRGQYFDVVNLAGTTEQLQQVVTPPGPATFVHNADNASDLLRAQTDAYLSANQVRDFLLRYVPNYPVISTQSNFLLNVNRSDGFCPGNAWYDGSSLNFCAGGGGYANTAFASFAHHEYGHHIVQSGGSGQGAYGEGMGDAIASLLAGDPGISYGFSMNQCTTPLRSADNACQYSASTCSSCGSEDHTCGNLLSGTIWSIRKALATSQPETYVDLLNALVLSSIPLHVGSHIDSSIAVDLLTLDDDDSNLDNGSPHYDQICAGFAAHGMSCPPKAVTGLSVAPADPLIAAGPRGGPFTPESVSYTLENLGPESTIAYTVAPATAAPWLSITNASGQIARGQQAQVTVAIDQATAGALSSGIYRTTLQFRNLTNENGNASREARLESGVKRLFSEDFAAGPGRFSVGAEPDNRWHVSSGCASKFPGHSAPGSLYFGNDSTCSFAADAGTAGTATSTAIDVTDTSRLQLGFNYYLQTENQANYDNATVQVSINGGPFVTVASNGTGGAVLSDSTGTWQAADIDLSSLLSGLPSASIRLRFGFDSVDGALNDYAGFFIDDVEVRGFTAGCTSNTECDDGAFCTGLERCLSGSCVAGSPIDCNDGVSCTEDSCNEAAKACSHVASDLACDDGQVCNGSEFCDRSLGCQSGAPLSCNDGDACTADSCDPALGCRHTTIGCDDDDACTTDACSAGVCTHSDNGNGSSAEFMESDGQVVMEAEHFALGAARLGHAWELTSDATASAGRAMVGTPNRGWNLDTSYVANSPSLSFLVKFTTTGVYHVWLRGSGTGTGDRTVHAGLDGERLATSDRISGFSATYAWSQSTLDGSVATIDVTRAGVHTVNLWMREDGFKVDRLLLTTNADFVPSGAGPAESARAGACASASSGSGGAPCSGLCDNPRNFNGALQSGNLGTLATCHQTTAAIHGGNCGNFLSPRALFVNGTQMSCDSGNWPTLPAKINGGYCVYTTAGNQPWAFFTTW